MKKTFSINLGGQVFQIDEDAYEKLRAYLDAIKTRYRNTQGAEEILGDIEGRLAEMLTERINNRLNVVSLLHIEECMAIMGDPAQFGDEASEETADTDQPNATAEVKRKFFRNPDDQTLGGVVSGLSAFLGIEEVVWVRLFVVLLFFFSGGTVLVAYIILWVIVPEANTPSEKLQMRGEPINIENIEKVIKKDFQDLENRVKNIDTKSVQHKARTGFQKFIDFCLVLFKYLIKALAKLVGLLFILFGLSVIIVVLWSLLLPGTIMTVNTDVWPYIFNSSMQVTLAIIALCLLVFVPLIGLTISGFRILLGLKKSHRSVGISFTALWFLGLVLGFILLLQMKNDFKRNHTYKKETVLNSPSTNVLNLVLSNQKEYDGAYIALGNWGAYYHEGSSIYVMDRIKLDVVKSETDDYVLVQENASMGNSQNQAIKNAQAIEYHFAQKDSVLSFDEFFSIPTSGKIRGQELQLTLKIPEGGSVYFANNIRHLIYDIRNTTNTYDGDMVGHTWTMKFDGLTCVDCEDEGREDREHGWNTGAAKEYDISDANDVEVNGAFDVEIRTGKDAAVKVYGAEEDTKHIQVLSNDGKLTIGMGNIRGLFKFRQPHKIKIQIDLPQLQSLEVNGPCYVSGKGLKGDEVVLKFTGASSGVMHLDCDQLTVEANGAAEVKLSGNANKLKAEVVSASSMDAGKLTTNTAEIEATGASAALVNVKEKLDAEANGASSIEYLGNPIVSSDASGASSINPVQ
ncbi:MAG: DUF2807 domain-containing protein [Chitinophagales bacterium]|nr:DUF2807 domain-containing protein [Chitinophagales bacterium]